MEQWDYQTIKSIITSLRFCPYIGCESSGRRENIGTMSEYIPIYLTNNRNTKTDNYDDLMVTEPIWRHGMQKATYIEKKERKYRRRFVVFTFFSKCQFYELPQTQLMLEFSVCIENGGQSCLSDDKTGLVKLADNKNDLTPHSLI